MIVRRLLGLVLCSLFALGFSVSARAGEIVLNAYTNNVGTFYSPGDAGDVSLTVHAAPTICDGLYRVYLTDGSNFAFGFSKGKLVAGGALDSPYHLGNVAAVTVYRSQTAVQLGATAIQFPDGHVQSIDATYTFVSNVSIWPSDGTQPPPPNQGYYNLDVTLDCPGQTPTPTPTPSVTPTPTPTPPPTPTPTPTPSAAPTPTPTPSATPPPDWGSPPPSGPVTPPPPNPTVPPGNAPPNPTNGNPQGLTNQDIYADVKAALNDAGNGSSGPDINSKLDLGDQPSIDPNLPQTIKGDIDTLKANTSTLAQNKAVLDTIKVLPLPNLPGPVGGQGMDVPLNVPTYSVSGPTGSGASITTSYGYSPDGGTFIIPLSIWSDWFPVFRLILLFFSLLYWWFSAVKIVRSGIS